VKGTGLELGVSSERRRTESIKGAADETESGCPRALKATELELDRRIDITANIMIAFDVRDGAMVDQDAECCPRAQKNDGLFLVRVSRRFDYPVLTPIHFLVLVLGPVTSVCAAHNYARVQRMSTVSVCGVGLSCHVLNGNCSLEFSLILMCQDTIATWPLVGTTEVQGA
jgi:hypothetical protein